MDLGDKELNDRRILSHDQCVDLVHKIVDFSHGGGETYVVLTSDWEQSVRWGRNRVSVASDTTNDSVVVHRKFGNGLDSPSGSASTNQVDDVSLQAVVRRAERTGRHRPWWRNSESPSTDYVTSRPTPTYPAPPIWSETTFEQTPDEQSEIVRTLVVTAEQSGMLSAGYLSVTARGHSIHTSDNIFLYEPQTLAECSMTVRDPTGTGSGWAGASSYDWARFDPPKLAAIALDKCLRSRNPVAVEPGRYTLIMEPQAAFDFFRCLLNPPWPPGPGIIRRPSNEVYPDYPYHDRFVSVPGGVTQSGYDQGMSRLGQRMVDERITISHDPTDPDLGIVPFNVYAEIYRPVTWFEKGVLTTLAYDSRYARESLGSSQYFLNSGSFRMSGGTTSVDEMISTTKRGLIVTRFSELEAIDEQSLLCTGLTRDGLWLIEDGKISKAVKNLRFTESPLFALNNIDQLGVPVPIYSPGLPAVVPPIKVKDFSFTALIDAI